MTTPKNNVVRLRLTELEREAWGRAAGGKGRLSEWIRATCNRAAITDVENALPEGVHPPYEKHLSSLGIPVAPRVGDPAPVVGGGWVEDARAHEAMKVEAKLPNDAVIGVKLEALSEEGRKGEIGISDEARSSEHEPGHPLPSSESVEETTTGVEAAGLCVRWMHHRPGVYCGSCKTVVK